MRNPFRRAIALAVMAAGSAAVLVAAALPAGAAQARPDMTCTNSGAEFNFVSPGTTPFYLGLPNKTVQGSAALLKPAANPTTAFAHCNDTTGAQEFAFVQVRDGITYLLTSRDFVAGGLVTAEAHAPGSAYASQTWVWAGPAGGPFTFQNLKTGLFLRVRNSGPADYQTVTTGHSPTEWNQTP